MKIKKDGIKILPKVGFHLWQYHFLRWNSRRLRGFEGSSSTAKGGLFSFGGLRGFEGSSRLKELPGLAEKPNKAFFGQRWAFPCLTVFKTARRLNLSLYGAKVGFHASKDPEDCQDCQRWASMVPKVGFSPLVGFEASKVGLKALFGPLVGFHTFYI